MAVLFTEKQGPEHFAEVFTDVALGHTDVALLTDAVLVGEDPMGVLDFDTAIASTSEEWRQRGYPGTVRNRVASSFSHTPSFSQESEPTNIVGRDRELHIDGIASSDYLRDRIYLVVVSVGLIGVGKWTFAESVSVTDDHPIEGEGLFQRVADTMTRVACSTVDSSTSICVDQYPTDVVLSRSALDAVPHLVDNMYPILPRKSRIYGTTLAV